ncbi:TPR-like protein [Wilcoxina mikolae CBS 423.85]|nr:TPR-like protein [Wilcoxina mikolae CBS 423.85]
MVPFARNMQFIGKNGQTSPLKERLDGGNRRGHQRLALWGLGGVGKTQDVLDFVYEYEGTQKSVFWIHAASKLRFEQDYRKLAQLVGIAGNNDPKQDIKPLVKCWFESPHSSEWILVLDNADNILDFYLDEEITDADESGRSAGLAKFLPHGTKGIIIVTTRDYEVADRLAGGMNTLNKQTMDMPKASLLFKQRYSRTVELEDEESISHLLKALHFLPLAIVQVADFLRLNQLVSPLDYLKQFNSTRESQKHLLDKPLTDVRRDPEKTTETILTTFSITFRQIQKQSPLAGSLLNIIACIDRQGIPHELLLHCGLHCDVSGNRDEFAIKEAISKLINFSLLTPVEYGRAYEMHSLVHVSVEAFQSPHEMHAAQESATKALAGILPNGEYNNHTVWRIYLPHASKLLGKVRTESIDTAKIHHHLSWYLEVVGKFSDAECSAQTSVKVHTDLLGQEHPDTLDSMGRLASTYWSQGRWKEAEELEVQVRETRMRVLGPDHPDTLNSMSCLASTYWSQGRWKEAEELEVQTMEMRKRVIGQEHPGTLVSISNLASIYQSQERWKEAEELGLQVTEMRKRVLGPEHPDNLTSMANLALTYQSQKRCKEAEELGLQVTETRMRVLGPDHPHTLSSMNCLASTYWSQGRLKEAEDLELKAMETNTRVLGQEHPKTLTSMHNLAFTYKSQGRIGEATALMASVVAIKSRILDTNSPSARLSTDTLAMWRNEMEMMST